MAKNADSPSALVVGAGVIGLMSARALLERGYSVRVVHDLPWEATTSSGAAGYIEPVLGSGDSSEAQRRFERSYPSWMSFAERHPDIAAIREARTLSLSPDVEVPSWASEGFIRGFRQLESRELPPRYTGGSGVAYKTVVVQPDRFMPWEINSLSRRGVDFELHHVEGVDELQGHDVVVNATSAWSPQLFNTSRELAREPFVGKTGRLVIFESVPGLINCSAVWDHPDGIVYVFPQPGQIIVGGTSEVADGRDPTQWQVEVNPGEFARMLQMAVEIEPLLAGRTPVRFTSGIRPYRTPTLVGAEEIGDLKVVHAVGTAGGGWTFGPEIGREVANLADQFLKITRSNVRDLSPVIGEMSLERG